MNKGLAWTKYRHLPLTTTFLEKVTPDIDSTNKTVVQCDAPIVRNTFVVDGDIQTISKNIFWNKRLTYCFWMSFFVQF